MPLLLIYGLVRSWMRGVPTGQLLERLGWLPISFRRVYRKSIWIHAVSVGEIISIEPLLTRLRKRLPGIPCYVSTSTPEGRQVAEQKLGDLVEGIFFAPFDFTFALRRCIETIRPQLVIVTETEIWPNLVRLSKSSGAGFMIVNGRMSDRSAPRYTHFRWFFSPVFKEVDRIIVQSIKDQDYFVAAGASQRKISIGGNLKYDFSSRQEDLAAEIKSFMYWKGDGPTPIIIAGSTREGEETPIIEAFCKISQKRPRALLVIAPRHPARFAEVARTIESSGVPLIRRSELNGDRQKYTEQPSVMLLDSIGELATVYGLADLVLMGGSLNGWGGHNLLEPALHCSPIVVGPYMHNFQDITADMLKRQAILQIKSVGALADAFEEILSQPQKSKDMALRALSAAEFHRGAAERASIEAESLYRMVSIPKHSGGVKNVVFRVPSKLWQAGVRIHSGMYDFGIKKRLWLDDFTLCVGNITTGGTGKTPTVMWLTEALCAAGLHPSVLTRGYHRVNGSGVAVMISGEYSSPLVGGDETQLFLRRFQQRNLRIPIGVGADRYRAGNYVSNHEDVDVFILDDGFQHHRLHKDFNLVLIDVGDPFGGSAMLPAGRLREPMSGLARASAFLLTRVQPKFNYGSIEEKLNRLNPSAPIYRSSVQMVAVREVAKKKKILLHDLQGIRALVFAGLGNADSFFRMVDTLRVNNVRHMNFPDHHKYRRKDIDIILEQAQITKAQVLITTEKDLVNMCHAAEKSHLVENGLENVVADLFKGVPLLWVSIETQVEQGETLIRRILKTKWNNKDRGV